MKQNKRIKRDRVAHLRATAQALELRAVRLERAEDTEPDIDYTAAPYRQAVDLALGLLGEGETELSAKWVNRVIGMECIAEYRGQDELDTYMQGLLHCAADAGNLASAIEAKPSACRICSVLYFAIGFAVGNLLMETLW